MSTRKSTRFSISKPVSGRKSESEQETGEDERRTLRAKVSSSSTVTPKRRSERTKNLPVLYNVPESSEASSPDKTPIGKSKSQPKVLLKKIAIKNHESAKKDGSDSVDKNATASGSKKSGRPKREEAQSVPEEEDQPRRSTRAPKPVQRLVDKMNNSNGIGDKTPTDGASPAVAASGERTRRKLTRSQIAENTDDKPTPPKVRKEKEPSSSSDTQETPRPTRKAALQKQPQKETPVKSKGTPSSKDTSKSKPGDVVQGKKLEWKFNVYGIPKCPLPCREAQFEEIWKFLFENVTEKNSGCMYVSGVPGTGKTVIVQAVIDTMQKISTKEKKNLQFQYLYINGLTLASPDKIWKRMFKGLDLQSKSKGISTKEALKRLDSYFESHQRKPVVLVVDELDQILDKQQSILYQLLEWSSHAKNMFSFVAIFNTMSLPEHGLAMRNYSRMGFKRAVFPPYNYEQLQAIVSNMLSTFKTSKLSTESVTLLSRKVAAISGDARRALEIARRAMEIAEAGNLSGIQAVSNAFKEIFSSAKIETIKHTSLLEQLILRAICDEVRCSGVEEVLTAKIYENVVPKAVYEGMQWPKDEILKALMRLALMHLVIVEDNLASLHKRVLLKVPVEDINFALGIHNDLEN